MTESRLSELIARKKAGEISPSESIELNNLLMEDASARNTLAKVEAIWNIPLDNAYTEDAYIADRWNALSNRLGTQKEEEQPVTRRSLVRRLARYSVAAASVAAIAIISIALWSISRPHETAKQNVISTKNGSRSKVQLPDGTHVWLNAGSQLTYNDSFGKEIREITLLGEAFFEVAKDAEHPFIIHTNTINIKVLGTSFNVRAYPDDKKTEATLINGLIEVSFNGRPSDRMYLKPNEKISVVNGEIQKTGPDDSCCLVASPHTVNRNTEEPMIAFSKVTQVSPKDSTVLETAWVSNKLIFRNKSFEDLGKEMERWYNISFDCKDSSLLQKHFTGSFYHESITEALDILRLSYPFHYVLDKNRNTIIIE
jgi:ferric-dicitrate binding protein FerR (iron transport regulator)